MWYKEPLDNEAFFPQLLSQVPEFRPFYDEHIADNDELLPHVLMADFTRFLIDAHLRATSEADDVGRWGQLVERSLALLEDGMGSSDDDLQNAISVSFLEHLEWAEEAYDEIKSLLGPKLREELGIIERFDDSIRLFLESTD